MRSDKQNRAMKTYQGFAGPATVSAILRRIPAALQMSATGRQLGEVMTAVSQAHADGRVAAEEEIAQYVGVPRAKLWDWLQKASDTDIQ